MAQVSTPECLSRYQNRMHRWFSAESLIFNFDWDRLSSFFSTTDIVRVQTMHCRSRQRIHLIHWMSDNFDQCISTAWVVDREGICLLNCIFALPNTAYLEVSSSNIDFGLAAAFAIAS